MPSIRILISTYNRDDLPSVRNCLFGLSRTSLGFWRHLAGTWFWESIALIFSAFCLAWTFAIAGHYNNKTEPHIWHGVTLNAIVSTLTTASKSARLFAIGSAFSQLKWYWITDKRSLYDLQIIDDASRGPLGSLKLLLCRRMPVMSIGALITVLSIMSEPFVQQVLKYPTRLNHHPDQSITTKKASGFHVDYAAYDFAHARIKGIWNTDGDFERSLDCPSGNCNWPRFRSVGWCSKCTSKVLAASSMLGNCNPSAFLQKPNSTLLCSIKFEDELEVVVLKGGWKKTKYSDTWLEYRRQIIWNTVYPWLYSMSPWYHDKAVLNPRRVVMGVENPYLTLGYISLAPHWDSFNKSTERLEVEQAEECILTPCLREYDISIVNSIPKVNTVAINYGVIKGVIVQPPLSGISVREICWQSTPEDIIYRPDLTGFDMNGTLRKRDFYWYNTTYYAFCGLEHAYDSVRIYLNATDSGFIYFGEHSSGMAWGTHGMINSFTWNQNLLAQLQAYNLSYAVTGLAASLTKLALDRSNETVEGFMTTSETFVSVEWAWLTLPVLLDLASVFFLLLTALTHRPKAVKLWKSSILPFLFYHPYRQTQNGESIPADIENMNEAAQKIIVKLDTEGSNELEILKASLLRDEPTQ